MKKSVKNRVPTPRSNITPRSKEKAKKAIKEANRRKSQRTSKAAAATGTGVGTAAAAVVKFKRPLCKVILFELMDAASACRPVVNNYSMCRRIMRIL